MSLKDIAVQLRDDNARVSLVYAFNATGKTQLSVAFKNATKLADGGHAGVYFNAYSEDLFVWDNDEENGGSNPRLVVRKSSLNRFHTLLTEDTIRDKLRAYRPKYGFSLNLHEESPEEGIASISFFAQNAGPDIVQTSMKISRGEERVFVWCFFLAMLDVDGWADKQSSHIFVDDPVSSLDDHNVFITASTIFDLIEEHFGSRKLILTTHHLGLFSVLGDWLTKGEKSSKYKDHTKLCILSLKSGVLQLESCKYDVFLYHLRLLQLLVVAQQENGVRAYHFALLRQVLENIASFLGVGQFGYVLSQIGISEPNRVADILNVLSHRKVYYYESDFVVEDNLKIFEEVLSGLLSKYNFKLHAS
jgi:hypothetical protein